MLLIFTGSANAQNVDVYFSLGSGLKMIDSEAAIGLDGKFSFGFKNFYANLNPLDLAFIPQGIKEGYRKETTSSGSTICRDTSTGQFAEKENCLTQYKTVYAFSPDINYMLRPEGAVFIFGLGYRLGYSSTPYFNAHVLFKDNPFIYKNYWYGNISAGKDFVKVGVGLAFSL